MFIPFPQNPTAKYLNYLTSKMKVNNIMPVFSQNILYPTIPVVSIHEYYIAGDWMPDHYIEWKQDICWQWGGYHDSLLLRSPRLWSGLQSARCTSVRVWIRTHRRKERSLLQNSPFLEVLRRMRPFRAAAANRRCEATSQQERTPDWLLLMVSCPPTLLELRANTGVWLKWRGGGRKLGRQV